MKISTVYVSTAGYQPTCSGLVNGELVWEMKMKEPWHLKMFPVRYTGDFAVEWMYLVCRERGYEYDSEESI